MLSETTAVRNAWAASERELQLRITINGQVFNAEDVTDFSYDSGAMNGESLTLGSTYANSIKITFSHIVEKLELQDKITPEIGIKLPDDTWNYTKLGVFIIDSEVKQDRNNGQTSLSATDNMVMLSGNYTSKIAYPTGVIESITDIANQAGVKLNEANIARLTDTTIGALGKEVTYRQAIGYVAQIAGGFAQFNRDGLLDIRGLEDPNFRITPDCYMSKGLTKNETFYRIGGMQAEVTTTQVENDGNENQETVTLQSGSKSGSQIKVANPAMSQQLLDQLYEQYADINFYPYSLEWFADPNLEAGDWVTIVDNKGNEFKAPALGLTLSFNGGLSGTLKADTTVTSQTTFVYSGQFNQVVTRLHNDFATIAGNHIYKGIDQPIFAKKGDLWYQSVGPDTVMQVYQFDPDTGLYSWVEVGSTKPSRELSDQMDQVKKDITDQSTKIDGAVANANTAVSNSDLATKTASAAKQSAAEAVTVANQANLISSQAQASALSAKSDANTAKANATQAIDDAAAAKGQATNALGQANTAIGNAVDALNKVNNMSVGGRNYLLNSNQHLTGAGKWQKYGAYISSDTLQKLRGKQVTISVDIDYTNARHEVGQNGRIGVEFTVTYESGQRQNLGVWKTTTAGESYSGRISQTMRFKDEPIISTSTEVWAYSQDLFDKSSVGRPKLEIGNVATDWSPAPEDVQIQIDNVNGELSQKVSQTTYNNLAGTVDTVSTLAKQNQSTISTLATKTSVDTVNKTATTAQTLAQQNANELLNKASTNTVDTLTQRVKTAESTLSQTATKAELALTQNDIDDLGDTVSNQGVKLAATATAAELAATQDNVDTLKKTVTNNTAGVTANAKQIALKANQTDVDTLKGTVTSQGAQVAVTASQVALKADTATVNNLGKTVASQGAQLSLTATEVDLEAAQSAVDAVTKTVTSNTAGITANANALKLKADSSTVSSLDGRVTKLSGQLDVQADKIAATVTASDVTGMLNGYATQSWSQGQIDAAKTAINLSVEQSITTSENTLNSNIANATKDMATQTWTQGQLSVTDGNISASVQKLHDAVTGEISTATTDMATKSWTQGKLDLTDSGFKTQISSVKDGLTKQYTQLQQTLDGVQVTANNAVTQGQLTLLSNQFTSTISGIQVGGTNLAPGTSSDWQKVSVQGGWGVTYLCDPTYEIVDGETYTVQVEARNITSPIMLETYFFTAAGARAWTPALNKVADKDGKITITFTPNLPEGYAYFRPDLAFNSNLTGAGSYEFRRFKIERGNKATDWSPAPEDVQSQFTQLQDDINLRVKTGDLISQINLSAGSTLIQSNKIYLSAASTVFGGSAFIPAASIKDLSADYIKAGTLDGSFIHVINLVADNITSGTLNAKKVKVTDLNADNITAGTLNAQKVGIVGLKADNITSGTLNAANVNIINLNASSIKAGIITGDNLSINLDSGEVLFQKGSIKSATNGLSGVLGTDGILDIEIEDGTFTQSDKYGNGIRFESGSMYFAKSVLDWRAYDPNTGTYFPADYGKIKYENSFLNSVPGMSIRGSEGIVVGTDSYLSLDPFTPFWGLKGSGISAGQQGVAVASEKKAALVSGQVYYFSILTDNPYILVGANNTYSAPLDWTPGELNGVGGSGISMVAQSVVIKAQSSNNHGELDGSVSGTLALACDGRSGYVLSTTTYNRTYSGSANMIITANGVYGRVTSARKYKLLDHDAETVIDHAKRVLDINPKQWFDKAEVETISKSLTESTENQLMSDYKFRQYYGFIADDFHDAGLDEVVQFKNGEVDSLAYDRIPMYHNVILKDHETRIEKLERENKELKQQLAAIS